MPGVLACRRAHYAIATETLNVISAKGQIALGFPFAVVQQRAVRPREHLFDVKLRFGYGRQSSTSASKTHYHLMGSEFHLIVVFIFT